MKILKQDKSNSREGWMSLEHVPGTKEFRVQIIGPRRGILSVVQGSLVDLQNLIHCAKLAENRIHEVARMEGMDNG